MYQPKPHQQTDTAQLHALMQAHPLAALVSTQGGSLTADHIPLMFAPVAGAHGALRGHVARANPLWREADGADVLAIFQGAQAYVSPSWYPSKADTHKVVPTWDYVVVHAQGRLRAIDDATWLRDFVSRLTAHHEAASAVPWALSDAPEDYIAQMLRAIVGIEIELTSLVGKWKVSQNRSAADREGVAAGLAQRDESARAMAALVALVRRG